MNKFKKISAILTSALLVFAAAGCSSDSNTVADIVSKTEALENYKGSVTLSTELNYQGNATELKMESLLDYNKEPFFAHTSITTSTKEGEGAENSYTSDMYLQTVDGVNTAYAGYNGVWYKQQVETDDFTYSVSQYNPVENGLLFIKSASGLQNMGSEQYNGMDVDRFEGTIPADMLSDVMETSGAIGLIGTSIDASYYKNVADQKVSIFVNEEGIIVGYSLDLTDLVSSLLSVLYETNGISDDQQIITANKYMCEGTVTEYNKGVDTTLSDDAQNAIEMPAVTASNSSDSSSDGAQTDTAADGTDNTTDNSENTKNASAE